MSVQHAHRDEVRRGERFEFGKNWSKFLKTLTEDKVRLAEVSLTSFLGVERLDGRRFLDIGSGSGLFSLAARRLGASVHSFDYDPHSYGCTRELRRRYFEHDPDWVVERGSVLDRDYLAGLGTFDVVYSWGVLHHTGAMWVALDNVKPLARIGGQLFIAIYNDQGEVTDEWARIKARYNALPKPLDFAYALRIIGKEEARRASAYLRAGKLNSWIDHWVNYGRNSLRGMNQWHDWIDWIGGYPYERATLEKIIDFYSKDGFRIDKIADRTTGYGCNEFVFTRLSSAGVFVDNPVPGGSSMARRHGRRLLPPFKSAENGWIASIPNPPKLWPGTDLVVLQDDRIVGTGILDGDCRIRVNGSGVPPDTAKFFAVAAELRPLTPQFEQIRGRMWMQRHPDLADRSDTLQDATRSNVYVFEDGEQLPFAHALHDQIADAGHGRFSHWSDGIYFSPLTDADPASNGRSYSLLIVGQALSSQRALGKAFGAPLRGPYQRDPEGWSVEAPKLRSAGIGSVYLLRDDELVGPARFTSNGRVVVAALESDERGLGDTEFYVVAGRVCPLPGPYEHGAGFSWTAQVPDFSGFSDNNESPGRSTLFVFEGSKQLPLAHSPHADIAQLGSGRFSHWGESLYFSSLNGTDPNPAGRDYSIFIPDPFV